MTSFSTRIGEWGADQGQRVLCDAWLAGGRRFGDEHPGIEPGRVLGCWPGDLETDAVVRLAQVVGSEPTWDAYTATPAVAQKLAERARSLPLDLEIARHLQHLQHVCHRPRLHLRVEDDRLPVSRARRTPVRAVAELVSHPGDWEHRTLRSIQPSRVLARQVEDEWNLYENRVAVRLVDHLLAYLARRLEELRRIKGVLDASRDYSEEVHRSSFRRAERIAELWSSTLDSKTEDELKHTMDRLEFAQRDLQTLLSAPLYQRVPVRLAVALALQPTNILVNDPHYRKVAALWRAWVRFGHKRQETAQKRLERRQSEAAGWDRFVLHLVGRGFAALGWSAARAQDGGWVLSRPDWLSVRVRVDGMGLVHVSGTEALRIVPLCADLSGADPGGVLDQLRALDDVGPRTVVAHVGEPAALSDADRASGWTIGGRAVLFPCSPWGIDSEERMARLLHGWLSRAALPQYPVATTIQALPEWPGRRDWLRHERGHLVAFRAPNEREAHEARVWAAAQERDLDALAQRAKAAKKAYAVGPREAVAAFQQFMEEAAGRLAGLATCPVCGGAGVVEPRPGSCADGKDAMWWAMCSSCGSEWGARPCTQCRKRYHAIQPHSGLDTAIAASATAAVDWPDRVLGRDVWAQPCSTGGTGRFRCPWCGACSADRCESCTKRQGAHASTPAARDTGSGVGASRKRGEAGRQS